MDAQLRTASWAIDDSSQVVREFRLGTMSLGAEEPREASEFAFYSVHVLLDRNGIVEELLELDL